jgi:hypothetical protein
MKFWTGGIRAIVKKRMMVKPNVKISYPHISGLQNTVTELRINEEILKGVYQLIRMQKEKDITEMVGQYEIKLNGHGLLSVVMSNYAIWKEAAHGMTYQSSYTFNLTDGRTIPLAELFKPGNDYQKRLSDIVKRQIKERDVQLITDFKRIDPNQSYYLSEKELTLYFQLYEYTPYYYGFPTFSIPYKEIADMINPRGPLGLAV